MSHVATSWAVSIRGLSSGEFRVLLVLADCHNPSRGCFPSQSYLREACEMSNGALNSNLGKLAEKGLVQRERRGNSATGGRASTRYILGFEGRLTPESGDKVNSGEPEIRGGLTPESGVVNSGGPETEPVKEPVKRKEPVKGNSDSIRKILCSVLSKETADAFIAHRKAKRAKLTAHAAELIAKKLSEHPNPDEIANNSIMNGWTGVFPPKSQAVEKSNQPDLDALMAGVSFGGNQ